jgi:hypothetical protein
MSNDDQLTNGQLEIKLHCELEGCTSAGELAAFKTKIERYIHICDADLTQRKAYRGLNAELQMYIGVQIPKEKLGEVLEPFDWVIARAREDEAEVTDLKDRMVSVLSAVRVVLASHNSQKHSPSDTPKRMPQ